jgi:hypothetical protein
MYQTAEGERTTYTQLIKPGLFASKQKVLVRKHTKRLLQFVNSIGFEKI